MAKANWLTLWPTSGEGNATIQNTAIEHTGRVERTTTVTAVAVGVSPNKTYTVAQYPKQEFVSFKDGTEVTVGQKGGVFTLEGRSNAAKLTFSIVDNAEGTSNDLSLSLPANYTVKLIGASTGTSIGVSNGETISGDPGASEEYKFSITFTDIAENLTPNELQCALLVKAGENADQAQITIKQTGLQATFSFSNDSLQIMQVGGDVEQHIESNTSWKLE